MSWRVGDVQDTAIGPHTGPGFNLAQDGRSPTLSLLFEDPKTANECADLMQKIIDKASAIQGRDQ